MKSFYFDIMEILSDKFFCNIVARKVPEFSQEFFSIVPVHSDKIHTRVASPKVLPRR